MTLVTTGIVLYIFTGWSPATVIIGVGLFTLIYTMIGGITAVAWTNVAQGIILSGGALLILGRLLLAPEVGDPIGIIRTSWEAGKYGFGSWDLSWGSLSDKGTPTVWILCFAYLIQISRRYVTDQHVVQHYLIATTDRAASRGAIMGAISCLPIFWIFMFIGASFHGFFALNPGDPGPGRADEVMPYFLSHYMPSGVLGLVFAAILAAAMSSVSADLNSIATVLTTDYFSVIRPKSSDKARLLFGRSMVVTGGLLATAIAVLLVPKDGAATVNVRAIVIATIISAGSLGLFSLGFLTKRATRAGAYAGIAACVVFTGWALLSMPDADGRRIVDFRFNWELSPLLIGILGHGILFGVGDGVCVVFGGHRPYGVEELTLWSHKLKAKPVEAAPAQGGGPEGNIHGGDGPGMAGPA